MTNKIFQIVQKGIISGATAAVGIQVLLAGDKTSFVYGNRRIPVWQLMFGLGLSSALLNDAVSTYVLPHIQHNEKSRHLESMVLHAVSSGVIFYGVPKYMNYRLNMREDGKFVFVGIAADALAQRINDAVQTIEEGGVF